MHTTVSVWRSPGMKWGLLFSTAILLLLNFYHLSIFPLGPYDPAAAGDVATWVTGLLTSGAVIVAGLGLRAQRIKAAAEDAQREKESTGDFYSWIETRQLRPGQVTDVLVLMNRTKQPIYEWAVRVGGVGVAPIARSSSHGPVVPGERTIELSSRALGTDTSKLFDDLSIEFTSSEGKFFLRDNRGRLSEVEE